MTHRRRAPDHRLLAIVFLSSLIGLLFVYVVLPRLMARPGEPVYNPAWVPLLGLALGMVAVVTVPFAWRWLYRRGRAEHGASSPRGSAGNGQMRWLLVAAGIATVLTIALFVGIARNKGLADMQMNEIGDAVAGFASFLAFLWLIVTVLLQYSELRLQREEIADLRVASEDQANSLRMTNRVHTLTLLMSRFADAAGSIRIGVGMNAQIIVDFLKEHQGFQHASDFKSKPSMAIPYLLEYFMREEQVEAGALDRVIESGGVRDDFDYEAYLKIDALIFNMQGAWDVMKPLLVLVAEAGARDEFVAWQASLGIKWYPQHYRTLLLLRQELRRLVAEGKSGIPINRIVAIESIKYDQEQEAAGKVDDTFDFRALDRRD